MPPAAPCPILHSPGYYRKGAFAFKLVEDRIPKVPRRHHLFGQLAGFDEGSKVPIHRMPAQPFSVSLMVVLPSSLGRGHLDFFHNEPDPLADEGAGFRS